MVRLLKLSDYGCSSQKWCHTTTLYTLIWLGPEWHTRRYFSSGGNLTHLIDYLFTMLWVGFIWIYGWILKQLWNFKHVLSKTKKPQVLTHEGYTSLRCYTEISIFPFSLLYLAASIECINNRATLLTLALTTANSKHNVQVNRMKRSANRQGSHHKWQTY